MINFIDYMHTVEEKKVTAMLSPLVSCNYKASASVPQNISHKESYVYRQALTLSYDKTYDSSMLKYSGLAIDEMHAFNRDEFNSELQDMLYGDIRKELIEIYACLKQSHRVDSALHKIKLLASKL